MSHIDYDGPGELHITNITQAFQMEKTIFDRVITVCQDSIEDNVSSETTYNHYCMSDGGVAEEQYGGSCEYELFAEAADELYNALSDNETVLIHCHHGTSRSIAVATAALGRLLEKPRSEALDEIHYYRPRSSYPDSLLMDHTNRYIHSNTVIGSRFEKLK